MSIAYQNYWKRKQLLNSSLPAFPVLRWWSDEGLAGSERTIFEAVKSSSSLLDFGAGDLRVMKKLQAAGFKGEYHTQDIGTEYVYTYQDLSQIHRKYGAVVCLDVVEHLPLEGGLGLIDSLIDLLETGGILVLQTPNARCVRNPLANDMTHLHAYSVSDLWAYLTCKNLDVKGYRVDFLPKRPTIGARIKDFLSKLVITRLLGCDYAENILLIGSKIA